MQVNIRIPKYLEKKKKDRENLRNEIKKYKLTIFEKIYLNRKGHEPLQLITDIGY